RPPRRRRRRATRPASSVRRRRTAGGLHRPQPTVAVVADVAFAPGEVGRRMLATAGHDRSVRFWDVQAGRPTAIFDWALGKIDFVIFSRDGMRVAAGGSSGAVVVWDVEIC
ncbi:MAG: WD40 repeat domain-containing protein, partial [Planctomycetia bacterium]